MKCFVVLLTVSCLSFGQSQRDPNELLREAVTFQQAGQLKEAISDYKIFLAMYPDVPEVRSNLGAALVGAGRYSEAITEYKRTLEQKPDPKVRLNLALAYYKSSDLQKAITELEAVRQSSPADLQAVLLLADCYLSTGQNAKVVDMLDPLWKADPSNPAISYLLGTALIRDDKISQGQLVIDKIFGKGDSAESLLLMGTTKLASKDFNAALIDLKKAVEMNPALPEVHSYFGIALLASGDTEEAKKAFREELKSNPTSFEANMRLGVLLRQDQSFDQASEYLRVAQKLRPGNVAVRYQVAALDFDQGRVDQARAGLESVVKEAPSFTEAHVKLATVYYRQKRKSEGDKERGIVEQLTAERQAKQPAVIAQ